MLAHGGTIEVSSSERDGTSFRVQLPRDARAEGNPSSVRGGAGASQPVCGGAINGGVALGAQKCSPEESRTGSEPSGEELPR